MGRLFITKREINFINDLGKELVKDIIGQKIYYFSISEVKSKVHDVYEESPDKVFENPIELDALVKWDPQQISTNRFGSEEYFSIEVYLHAKDLLDKGIELLEGDFFSYGTVFYEVIKAPDTTTLFGQIEHKGYITITGKQSRKGQFTAKIFGPTDEKYTDKDAVQETFVQQRGHKKNRIGVTGDIRDLQKNGVLDAPITGPKETSPRGDSTNVGSSFYDED